MEIGFVDSITRSCPRLRRDAEWKRVQCSRRSKIQMKISTVVEPNNKRTAGSVANTKSTHKNGIRCKHTSAHLADTDFHRRISCRMFEFIHSKRCALNFPSAHSSPLLRRDNPERMLGCVLSGRSPESAGDIKISLDSVFLVCEWHFVLALARPQPKTKATVGRRRPGGERSLSKFTKFKLHNTAGNIQSVDTRRRSWRNA